MLGLGTKVSRTCYEIDLGAIRHNYRELRKQLPPKVKVYACLKRNAYGCGARPVARVLAAEGVNGFGVATLSDAAAIRGECIDHPILLYPGAVIADAASVQELNLIVSVSSPGELDQWCRSMPRVGCFVKVDLGFFRAGATPHNALRLLAEAYDRPKVDVLGIYAHLSELGGAGVDAVSQFGRFNEILLAADAAGHRPPIAMLSSTEGVVRNPEMDLEAVDPGSLFFGFGVPAAAVRQLELRPALKAIKTVLVSVKRLDASLGPLPDLPGYHRDMTIGVLAFGWGDGYPRAVPPDAKALVRGVPVPVLGPAHLEHLRVDLSHVPDAAFGDEAVILGRQQEEAITLASLTKQWKTDSVGIYGQLRDHIPRVYAD